MNLCFELHPQLKEFAAALKDTNYFEAVEYGNGVCGRPERHHISRILAHGDYFLLNTQEGATIACAAGKTSSLSPRGV